MDPSLSEGFSVPELQAVVAPHLRGPVDGDSNAALAACTALLFGLAHQRRTGEGQFVSTSMIGGNLYAYTDDAVTYGAKAPLPRPDMEHLGLGALYRLYRARDRWLFLAAPKEREWNALVDVVDDDALRSAQFATAADRRTSDAALAAALVDVFATRDAAEWESALSDAGVGCAAVYTSDFQMGSHAAFVAEDPVMFETGMSADVEHPLFGTIRRHGLPVHLSETPGRIAPGCLRGQHTEAILAELGYLPDEIEKLQQNRVVFGPD